MGHRAGLGGWGKSRPHRDSIPGSSSPSESLYRLNYSSSLTVYIYIYIYNLQIRETGTGQQVAQLHDRCMMMIYKYGRRLASHAVPCNSFTDMSVIIQWQCLAPPKRTPPRDPLCVAEWVCTWIGYKDRYCWRQKVLRQSRYASTRLYGFKTQKDSSYDCRRHGSLASHHRSSCKNLLILLTDFPRNVQLFLSPGPTPPTAPSWL